LTIVYPRLYGVLMETELLTQQSEINRRYLDGNMTRPDYIVAIAAIHAELSTTLNLGPCKCMACREVSGR